MHPRATVGIWITILYGVYNRAQRKAHRHNGARSAVPALQKSYFTGRSDGRTDGRNDGRADRRTNKRASERMDERASEVGQRSLGSILKIAAYRLRHTPLINSLILTRNLITRVGNTHPFRFRYALEYLALIAVIYPFARWSA